WLCAPRARPGERGADEAAEERRGAGRPRLELGMELTGDEPRMAGELDYLDEAPAVERAADDEAGSDELLAVVVVHLVTVPVALEDDRVAVQLARLRPLGHLHRLPPEAHRPAEIFDALLLREEVDDRERRLRVHLRRVGAVEADDVPRELRY